MSRRDILIFKNLETLTLGRDTRINKLEKAIKKSKRGGEYEEALRLAVELRRSRKALIEVMTDLKDTEVGGDIKEPVETLVEFNDLVAVPRERDLIKQLINVIETNGSLREVRKLKKDIEELNKLGALIREVLEKF